MDAMHANTAHSGSLRMPGIASGNTPVLGLDAREHACCLLQRLAGAPHQHQSHRLKHIDALYEVVNWAEVARRFAQTR